MNSHSDIKKLLSSYCGDDLQMHERVMLEEHLKECRDCRAELADLEITIGIIRTVPEVEPPPWMTARIMAHVRELQAEKGNWLKRILLPVRIRIPLELVTLLVVCVTGYYLTRSVETELKVSSVKPEPAGSVPARNLSPHEDMKGKPAGSLPAVEKGQVPVLKSVDRSPAPDQPPAAPPVYAPAPHSVTGQEPGAPASAPPRPEPASEAFDRVLEAAPGMRKKAAKEESTRAFERAAPAPAGRAVGSAGKYLPRLSLRLEISDRSKAAENVRAAAIRSGAAIIEEADYSANLVRIQVPSNRITELLENLNRVGRVTDLSPLPDAKQVLDVTIRW